MPNEPRNPHNDASRLMLYETAELVRELTNRFPTSVIAWVECQDGNPDARSMKYEFGGDMLGNMGLAAAVVQLTNRTFKESVRRTDE